MGDENPICTLGDYSKPSHEGCRNTIKLPVGNNVVPLRSDTIRLVQNGCSFYGLWSEDPKQHLKDFLKLVDSLDLDVKNKERTCLCLFQFSLRDQASNWLERLPAGSISTWEDLTTLQIFYDHVNPATRRTIDQSAGGKLRDRNAKESWALLEDLALCDNKSWNDPSNFAKPVKAISLPQDVLMNKITSSCETCSGPHDTQYCMENPEQAFVNYASSSNEEVGGNFMAHMNVAFVDYLKKEELWSKGIKILLKLLSPKYLSQSSLEEQNRNPSSPKHVHFINSIIILSKESDAKEEENVNPKVTKDKDHNTIVEIEKEVEEESEEEFEEETKEETGEEEEDDPEYFDMFPILYELR
ncbi:hypothetical protein Tco_1277349 [Tanacetum coccineum]